MNTFRNLYLHSEYSLLSLESESSEGHSEYSLLSLESESSEGIFVVH